MPENLTDILFFSEVARAGSITAAARRLATPKSTVSRRLIRFEERIGSKLFYKTTRKIVLTEPIKQLGAYTVAVKIDPEVEASVKLTVNAEQAGKE